MSGLDAKELNILDRVCIFNEPQNLNYETHPYSLNSFLMPGNDA
jgi:hypothetical protein